MVTKRTNKTDITTVLLHWGLVLTLIFSLLTGLRIAADEQDSFWAQALSNILLQGDVIPWHIWAASTLAFITMAYLAYLLRARLRSRLALDRTRVRNLFSLDRQSRWNAVNIVIYWLAFFLLIAAVITGVILYWVSDLLPYETVADLHQLGAWLLIAYVFLHVIAQLFLGGMRQLLKILNLRVAYGAAAFSAITIATLGFGALYALDTVAIKELRVAKISEPPLLDGNPSDSIWEQAIPVHIHTARGVNFPGNEVTVQVRALHDNDNIYALFEWPDSQRSQKHLPLVKTATGWQVMQKEFSISDEDDYYEDKFGVMLARSPTIAGAKSINLGPKPLPNKPAPNGKRGLHYTTDGSIVDVWHWKSVRTGSVMMNQIDDNFFGPPLPVKSGKKRYTGGYSKDPKSNGGFKMNWEQFSVDRVTPLRLPKDPAILDRMGAVDLDPNAGDTGEMWLTMKETVPYAKELDTYPVGTVLPAVLIEGPFVGDRGDVTAVAKWKDGWWRMEVSRKLNTGSEYDIAITKDQPTYLWVAAFNHTQTRHSQHLHPVEIVLE